MDARSDDITAGRVLRAWRDYAGLTQSELAAAITALDSQARVTGKGTVANWESGERNPGPRLVGLLTRALELGIDEQHALVGMWWAAGCASAVPPRSHWEHNYHEGAGPVWLWMWHNSRQTGSDREPSPETDAARAAVAHSPHSREFGPCGDCARAEPAPPSQGAPVWLWIRHPASGPMGAEAGWGPFGTSFQVDDGPAGAIVHAGASLPNPPVQVTLQEPGWVDFGSGVIPRAVLESLGIQALDGADVFRGRFADPPMLTEVEAKGVRLGLKALSITAVRIDVRLERFRDQMGAMRPSRRPQPLTGARIFEDDQHVALQVDGQGELISQLLLPPALVKEIRTARSMSAAGAASLVSSMSGQNGEITANQIETLDKSGHLPAVRDIIARLDHVYGLDGHLGIGRTANSDSVRMARGACRLDFPDFWVGPVWLQLRAPAGADHTAAEGVLDLRWGHWRRLQTVEHGTIVTMRKSVPSQSALAVRLPPGWRLAAGTGAVPGAIDINHDWRPYDWPAAARLALEGFQTIRAAGRIQGLEPTPAPPDVD